MTKLVDHEMLAGKAPAAWKETAFRCTGEHGGMSGDDYEETRMELIVDERDAVLGCVTERYTLVQNRDLLTALDLAADAAGVRLEPQAARYENGRAEYKFNLPGQAFAITRDPSLHVPQIVLRNDYRGSGGLGIMAGWFRMICSNGMVIGEVAHQKLRRHVGEIDLYGFVQAGVHGITDRLEVERLTLETLQTKSCPVTSTPAILDRDGYKQLVKDGSTSPADAILADTADRYHKYLRTAVRENRLAVGDTAYALVNAITQTATHRMPGWTADAWATKQIARVKEAVL
jgi:hypothetical protein